jgi:hypothetical protein
MELVDGDLSWKFRMMMMMNNIGKRKGPCTFMPISAITLRGGIGSAQQAWEKADVKCVGDGNKGRPLGLTGLGEVLVESKQFPSKLRHLSHRSKITGVQRQCGYKHFPYSYRYISPGLYLRASEERRGGRSEWS